jgi:hypothetical protein
VARTFSDGDEERLRQLHADGLPRNRIAQEMGWSLGTISNHARRLGLSFDREATRAATDARQVDLKDRRQRIQEQLLDLAERAIERTQREYELANFDPMGQIVVRTVPLPPARETKDLTTAAMSALARFDQKAKDDAENNEQNLAAIDRFLQSAIGQQDE